MKGGIMDKRHTPRRRTFKGGKIFFNHDRSVIDCTVKNLSPDGAALLVQSVIGIPGEFNLVISSDNVSRACRVVWKTETQIGVHFVGT